MMNPAIVMARLTDKESLLGDKVRDAFDYRYRCGDGEEEMGWGVGGKKRKVAPQPVFHSSLYLCT